MKIGKIMFGAVVSALVSFSACDDNTSTLGVEVMPEGDFTISTQTDYDVQINSLKVDKILARTTTAYLGKYTDPYTNTEFESDFLTQFYCPENFEFPDKSLLEDPENPEAQSIELNLYYSTYFGDSLAAHKLAVHELNRVLEADELYYTNLDASQYYDASKAPLQTQAYTAIDQIHGDSLYESNGVHMLTVPLPKEFGDRLIKAYYENPDNFKNSEKFIRNVLPGFYIKHLQGDGSVLNINYVYLDVYFKYKIASSSGKVDSLVTAFSQFIATPEVIQENRFSTKNIEELLTSKDDVSYIQTPAGIFTEITLPIEQVSLTDTINSASLTIYRENMLNESRYQMGTPSELLMIPKAELETFFEENKVPDYVTSYTTTFSNNQYAYSNIANLINTLRRQVRDNPNGYNKNADGTINEDWNKVVLIPITKTTQQNSSNQTIIIRVLHDLSQNFVKLKKNDIKLKIIYSKYKDAQ